MVEEFNISNLAKVTSLQNKHLYAGIQSVTIHGDLTISSGVENVTLQENSSALRVWATLSVYCQGVQYDKGPCGACPTKSLGGY